MACFVEIGTFCCQLVDEFGSLRTKSGCCFTHGTNWLKGYSILIKYLNHAAFIDLLEYLFIFLVSFRCHWCLDITYVK